MAPGNLRCPRTDERRPADVADQRAEPIVVNGKPGFFLGLGDTIHSVASFDIEEGRIATVYIIRNPDKLHRTAEMLGRPLLGG